jgi:hypothetical protein
VRRMDIGKVSAFCCLLLRERKREAGRQAGRHVGGRCFMEIIIWVLIEKTFSLLKAVSESEIDRFVTFAINFESRERRRERTKNANKANRVEMKFNYCAIISIFIVSADIERSLLFALSLTLWRL